MSKQVKSTKITKHNASKKAIKGIKVQHVKNLSRGEKNHQKYLEFKQKVTTALWGNEE